MANYLVTGAAGGMGAAICRTLTEEGNRVWGLDLVPPPEIPEGETFIAADVTDASSLDAAYETIRREAGVLNGIVHAAGIYDLASLVEMPEEEFLRDFDINVFGAFRINRLFLPLLEKGSRIVLITSELAPLHPLPFTGVYAVTKAALDRYAEALRMELQLLGHWVIVVRPGAVRTAMLDASTSRLTDFCETTELYRCNADRFRRIVDRVEARNIPPEKVAGVVLRSLRKSRPRPVYNVNRNPLLLAFQILPEKLRLRLIRRILS